jgi:hypothetical protein
VTTCVCGHYYSHLESLRKRRCCPEHQESACTRPASVTLLTNPHADTDATQGFCAQCVNHQRGIVMQPRLEGVQ